MKTFKLALLLFPLVFSLLFIGIPYAKSDPIFTIVPPPTPAISKVKGDNGTIYTKFYNTQLNLQGSSGLQIHVSNNSKTVYFSTTLTNGTTITPITCSLNSQIHSVNSSGFFFCAANNSTGSSVTLDTMQNLIPSQASIYAGNNTNVNFQFKGLNFTGSLSAINGSSIITIHGNIYQNNTGTNLGTHGQGVFNSMSGAILQFLKILTGSGLSSSSNSTNILLSLAIKVNNSTCGGSNSFFKSFDNVTGNSICGSVSGFLTNAILTLDGDSSAAQTLNAINSISIIDSGSKHIISCSSCINGTKNGGHATGSIGVLASPSNNKVVGRNMTGGTGISISKPNDTDITVTNTGVTSLAANSPISVSASTGSVTASCSTCLTSAITSSNNAGKATTSTGVLASPTSSAVRGKNMSSTTNLISFTNSNATDVIASSTFKSNNISCVTGNLGTFVTSFVNTTGAYVCTSPSMQSIDNHKAASTENTYTINFSPALSADSFSQIHIEIDGQVTASLALQMRINGNVSSGYQYSGTSSDGATNTVLNGASVSSFQIESGTTAANRPFYALCDVSLSNAGQKWPLILCQAHILQSGVNQLVGGGELAGYTSISSITILTSTSTWTTGTHIVTHVINSGS